MTKPTKRARKHNVRSEAAMRKAIKKWTTEKPVCREHSLTDDGYPIVNFYDGFHINEDKLIAIFDLRDCYRKRQPLKGITKAVRKAVQPRGKK